MHFVVRGRNLKRSLVESAIKLSHTKYCSASAMLGKTAAMTHDYELIEEAAPQRLDTDSACCGRATLPNSPGLRRPPAL